MSDTTQEGKTVKEPELCRRRTLKGGAGVDDASGVREWLCSREKDHPGECEYTRDPHDVTTATS